MEQSFRYQYFESTENDVGVPGAPELIDSSENENLSNQIKKPVVVTNIFMYLQEFRLFNNIKLNFRKVSFFSQVKKIACFHRAEF